MYRIYWIVSIIQFILIMFVFPHHSSHYHSPFLSYSSLLPVFACFYSIKCCLCCLCTLACAPFMREWSYISSLNHKKKTPDSSPCTYQLQMVPQLGVKVSVHLTSLCWIFFCLGLPRNCACNVMNSYEHLPCYVLKTLFLCHYLPTVA